MGSRYQEIFTHPFMRPRVNVGAIEGGVPQNRLWWLPSATPTWTSSCSPAPTY